MLAVAALAVLIDDVAHGERTAGFALAYVALRSIVLALYWRAWRAVPAARPLVERYGAGYAAGVALWLGSLALSTPGRYALWGIALAVELSLPPLSTRLHRRVPTHGTHVPERWGLFTIIVLGESVVAVALESTATEWRLASVGAGVLGFAVVGGSGGSTSTVWPQSRSGARRRRWSSTRTRTSRSSRPSPPWPPG